MEKNGKLFIVFIIIFIIILLYFYYFFKSMGKTQKIMRKLEKSLDIHRHTVNCLVLQESVYIMSQRYKRMNYKSVMSAKYGLKSVWNFQMENV